MLFGRCGKRRVKAIGKFNGAAARDALLAAAEGDEKSEVRREAIKALGKFSHDQTRSALRKIIAGDKSYYAVADALRTLLKVDRANCAADLLAALDVESHNNMILKAACDGLIALKETQAVAGLKKKLGGNISPQQRVVLVSALARLDGDNPKNAELLREQLDNERSGVRRAAIDALVKIGGPESLEALLARRAQRRKHPYGRLHRRGGRKNPRRQHRRRQAPQGTRNPPQAKPAA